MLNIIVPILTVFFLALFIHSLLKSAWARAAERAILSRFHPLSPQDLAESIRLYGRNTNSFLALYPGFEHFTSKNPDIQGFIPFVRARSGWVAAAEPLVAADRQIEILKEFSECAEQAGKVVVMLPVEETFALRAAEAGYHSVMIGCEPTFVLGQYPPAGKSWNDIIAATKQLVNKGAAVTEFNPNQISPEMRAEFDEITQLWLDSRKMEPLAFLNQVDPWLQSEHKRYFKIGIDGKVLAFIAAIPIMARNGWYLIDVMRRPDSQPGSTEMLTLHAMRILFESGTKEISLGVAPLSRLETSSDHPAAKSEQNALLYRMLHWIYKKGKWFYGFNSLYQYKMKFKPTLSPPAFALIRTRGSKNRYAEISRVFLSLAEAMMPKGVALATVSNMIRVMGGFSPSDWIKSQVRSTIIVRSVPPNWLRLLQRCKFTVAILGLNLVVFFFTTDRTGHIHPQMEMHWGFSWNSFLAHPLHALFLSPFLHWSITHFCFNLIMIVIFTGTTEYLTGSRIVLAAYGIPTLLANPITGAILVYGLKFLFHSFDPGEIDIGASLGCVGTAGALYWFVRRRKVLVFSIIGATLLDNWFTHAFMPLNHVIAFGLGILVARGAL